MNSEMRSNSTIGAAQKYKIVFLGNQNSGKLIPLLAR